ncbi:MAG: hypothetical protein ACWA42_05615 [Lutibacter sp.]
MNLKTYYKKLPYLAFLFFTFSAIFGFLIRFHFAFPQISINYQNILQGHSHIAFLGWGFLISIYFIHKNFVEDNAHNKNYNFLTIVLSLILILLLFSFVLFGYKLLSIVLLSVFNLLSYFVLYFFLKRINADELSKKFIKTGIYFYLLSNISTWFLGYLVATQGKTILFYNTIYFYMHFLYNGYFPFVIVGLFLKYLENNNYRINNLFGNRMYFYLTVSCLLTFFISILWSTQLPIFIGLSLIGSIFQIVALYFLYKIFIKMNSKIYLNKVSKIIIVIGLLSFGVKILLQLIASFPEIMTAILGLKHFLIIGFIHLITIGFISMFMIFYLIQNKFLIEKLISFKIGIYLFIIGFILTELIMFFQGALLFYGGSLSAYYNYLMLGFTLFITIGIVLLGFSLSLKKSV